MITQAIKVFFIFLRLGLTSFGGPVAHLGFFHQEFVVRRRWLDESAYADLVSLCQFLPGPASSQVGIALGLNRAGPAGAVAAWLGFTLPSAVIMTAFGLGFVHFHDQLNRSLLHGFKLAAIPIVAHALWTMSRKFSNSKILVAVSLISAALVWCLPFGWGQLAVIVFGAFSGLIFCRGENSRINNLIQTNFKQRSAALILFSFLVLLVALPEAARESNLQSVRMFDSFFRAGSLVFGGGHVVLPLLKSEVVAKGWVSADSFMLGYGVAQAVPGPLFAFSAYLGSVSQIPPSRVLGAFLCLVAAFLPSFFLVFGALPFWESIQRSDRMRAAVQGINAAVVGLLLSAFYDPVCTSSLHSAIDFALVGAALVLLIFFRWPTWAIVLLTGLVFTLSSN